MKKVLRCVLIGASLFFTNSALFAAEDGYSPWLHDFLKMQSGISQQVIRQKFKGKKDTSFYETEVCAKAAVLPELQVEAGLSFLKTRYTRFLPKIYIASQYAILNDLQNDPISLSIGANIFGSAKKVVHDPLTKTLAQFGIEAFVSIGREFGYGKKSYNRIYCTALVGKGTAGKPWLKAALQYKYIYNEKLRFGVGLSSCKGFGTRYNWHRLIWKGYSKIDFSTHRIAVHVGYQISENCHLFGEVSKTIKVSRFPSEAAVQFGIHIPLSIL